MPGFLPRRRAYTGGLMHAALIRLDSSGGLYYRLALEK